MGLLKTFFIGSVGTILAILFAPGIPPHIKFESFTLEPPRTLEGKLALNSILDKAEEILLDKPISGPESIAIRGDEIFTGIIGGELVRIKNGRVSTITRIGKQCEGDWDLKNCGRIAGVRFAPDGKLIVADVAYGIFKVDVDTGAVETIVSLSLDQEIDGKRAMFPDDIDITKDGQAIFWSDASTNADVLSIFVEFFGEPSGRLIKYDTVTKQNTVLISNLHFSNGIQLSKNEDFVLVSETVKARVLRYYLKGEKKGKTDVFVDRLPGLPDNIRPNGKGGFYITLASPRVPSELSLVDVLGPLPLVRKFISRVYIMLTSSLRYIESVFPGPVFREWIAYAEHLGPIGDFENIPYKTIIVETDGNGNIIGSLQNSIGPVRGLSEICLGDKYAYLGSPFQRKFFKIKTEYLKI